MEITYGGLGRGPACTSLQPMVIWNHGEEWRDHKEGGKKVPGAWGLWRERSQESTDPPEGHSSPGTKRILSLRFKRSNTISLPSSLTFALLFLFSFSIFRHPVSEPLPSWTQAEECTRLAGMGNLLELSMVTKRPACTRALGCPHWPGRDAAASARMRRLLQRPLWRRAGLLTRRCVGSRKTLCCPAGSGRRRELSWPPGSSLGRPGLPGSSGPAPRQV